VEITGGGWSETDADHEGIRYEVSRVVKVSGYI